MTPEQEITGEIEISIEPRAERLRELGIRPEDFAQALPRALDDYYDLLESLDDPNAGPDLEELRINLKGTEIPLGEIAEIRITGDLP